MVVVMAVVVVVDVGIAFVFIGILGAGGIVDVGIDVDAVLICDEGSSMGGFFM